MYTCTRLGTRAHTQTHVVTGPRGYTLGEVGLQGSSGHMLAPGLRLAPRPAPAHRAGQGLRLPAGAEVRWGRQLEATESSGGFLIYL